MIMSYSQSFILDVVEPQIDITIGIRGNLILAIYAAGSPFDIAVDEWRQGIKLKCEATEPVEDIATGASSSVSAGSCTDMEQDFWDSLSDITDLNSLDPPTLPGSLTLAGNTATLPKAGETCSGPVNSCATDSGCRCIAELSSDTGGQYFAPTCKPSHFEINGNKDGAFMVAGEDLLSSNTSLSGTNNTALGLLPTVIAPIACPCSCTYVSEACCEVPSGSIHEEAKFKLGKLDPKKCSQTSPTAAP